MDKYSKYFKFPRAILNQISECSPNGFMLFYIDNRGQPQIRVDFDTQMAEMCLRSYAGKVLGGINEVEEAEIADNLFKNSDEQEDEESEN